jgi:hypothetical protein
MSRCSLEQHLAAGTLTAVNQMLLASGGNVRGTAVRFKLGRHAVTNHWRNCITKAQEAQILPVSPEPTETGAVAQGIDALVTLLAAEVASSSGRARIDASREYRQALAEQAKSGGARGPVALTDVEDYPRFRALLIRALAPFPEARLAVADAIRDGGF